MLYKKDRVWRKADIGIENDEGIKEEARHENNGKTREHLVNSFGDSHMEREDTRAFSRKHCL